MMRPTSMWHPGLTRRIRRRGLELLAFSALLIGCEANRDAAEATELTASGTMQDAGPLDPTCIERLRDGSLAMKTASKTSSDAQMFGSAMGAMENGDYESARKRFLKLTDTYPESEFAPHAYFQFGELFLSEGKPDLAEKFYNEVLKHQPPQNEMFYLAALRLAAAQERQGHHVSATTTLTRAASGEHRHPRMPCSREISAAARRAKTQKRREPRRDAG